MYITNADQLTRSESRGPYFFSPGSTLSLNKCVPQRNTSARYPLYPPNGTLALRQNVRTLSPQTELWRLVWRRAPKPLDVAHTKPRCFSPPACAFSEPA